MNTPCDSAAVSVLVNFKICCKNTKAKLHVPVSFSHMRQKETTQQKRVSFFDFVIVWSSLSFVIRMSLVYIDNYIM